MSTPTTSAHLAAIARSFLFVPGDRPERFDKAWESSADAVILDLEDAVAPERKAAARQAVQGWLRADRPVWIRCNAADTEWFRDDLSLASHEGVAGFFVPKAESVPEALAQFVDAGLAWIPIIETARGMGAAEALACARGVVRLAFGTIDFKVDMGIEGDDDALLYFRSRLVLASRLAGCGTPLDGVASSISDSALIRAEAGRARRFGMSGKLCIHPRQVEAVHAAFEPSAAERDWARRVLEAVAASNGGAIAVDGKMVDRPVWLLAQRIADAPAASQRLRP